MQLLMIHVGLGGAVAAAGALVAGLILVGLRILLSPRLREQYALLVHQFGLVGAIRRALFDEPRTEADLHKGAAI